MHGCYKSQNDRKEFWEGEFRPRESGFLGVFFVQGEKGITMGNDKITRG